MKSSRRRFLQLAAGAAASPTLFHPASADAYPSRPAHVLVGYSAGGPADIAARLTARWLSEHLGQQFVVENRVGANSNIATEAIVRSSPDGYMLLLATGSNVFNIGLYDNLPFDFINDIVPVAGIMRTPGVMEVTASFPAKTVSEFISYAKANPGKINVASAGPGSAPHLYSELFKMMTGVDLVQVHYHGSGAALPDLIAGRVQVMFDPVASSIPHIRAGELRPLAVTTAERLAALPDVPTVGEFVKGYEASSWEGIGAPKDTPADIVDTLNRVINEGLADPGVKDQITNLGSTILVVSPSDFRKFIGAETEKWTKVIRYANIKPE